jgi:2-keto-4-pentenoate hydratase/2-oxohepta-3-ene-1,7-dioic acid hydratase in catechol pathway
MYMQLDLRKGDLITRVSSERGILNVLKRSGAKFVIDGPVFGGYSILATSVGEHEASDWHVLSPTEPKCIFGVGENFQHSRSRPLKERIFTKTLNTLAAHGSTLFLPHDSRRTVFEGELVAVIGREGRMMTPLEADEAILGYTVGNDFSEDGWFQEDQQWWRVKGVDGYSPVGPSIHVGFPGIDAQLTTKVNGQVRQSAKLSELRTPAAEVVAEISKYVTLCPGDLVFMGTPEGADIVSPGDVVEVTIDHIGTLRTEICRSNELKELK